MDLTITDRMRKNWDFAWRWYDRNISYRPVESGTQLVLLTGNYEGKTAIKIPQYLDSDNFRRKMESHWDIRIQNRRLFSSRYSITMEDISYNVYLYREA